MSNEIAMKIKFSKLCFLWVYGGILFSISGYLYLTRSGYSTIIKDINILEIATLFSIEVINQITFYLSKTKAEIASKLKCAMLWCILTISSIIFWVYLLKLEERGILWNKFAGVVFIFVAFTFCLPFYSLNTKIRFLFLYGKFGKRSKFKE